MIDVVGFWLIQILFYNFVLILLIRLENEFAKEDRIIVFITHLILILELFSLVIFFYEEVFNAITLGYWYLSIATLLLMIVISGFYMKGGGKK